MVVHENGDVDEHPAAGEFNHDLEDKKKSLSKVREKRWALFVARAVDRYEAWWDSLPRELSRLTEGIMTDKNSPRVDGISLSYVEPLQLPRRLHPSRPPSILAVRYAMGSRQRRHRRLFQLQRLRRRQGTLGRPNRPSMGQRRRPPRQDHLLPQQELRAALRRPLDYLRSRRDT
ncbi:hypothetical protein LB505_009619 [Fusarium chuoi]|nr:hypothetical protein LB505_009619 [Fusarium chuoi]